MLSRCLIGVVLALALGCAHDNRPVYVAPTSDPFLNGTVRGESGTCIHDIDGAVLASARDHFNFDGNAVAVPQGWHDLCVVMRGNTTRTSHFVHYQRFTYRFSFEVKKDHIYEFSREESLFATRLKVTDTNTGQSQFID